MLDNFTNLIWTVDLIKALTCLAKYGDDLMVYATNESLTFSSTNSSLSAYCRFKYSRQFFSRYQVALDARNGEVFGPTGQLGTKVWPIHSSNMTLDAQSLKIRYFSRI